MTQARIYQPAKTALQSGRAKTKNWILEFIPAQASRPTLPMGWIGGGDTLQQVRLRFDTLEDAQAYAQAQGIDFSLSTPHVPTPRAKNYADNFRHDRVR